ncbi:unnamed protein product [Polarella glacialis]|uniref:Glycosyl transferase family 25 domain-containing protein n=1 Tax=Polarella glacialis TaxID=89957 RepID=A0A813GZA3_POLGL|nr:unnamed protein product [Polarella glacialis]
MLVVAVFVLLYGPAVSKVSNVDATHMKSTFQDAPAQMTSRRLDLVGTPPQGMRAEPSSTEALLLGKDMGMRAHTQRDTETPHVPSRIFYINLGKSTDRRAHMEMALSGFPGHVERVPAVSASEVNRPPFSNYMRVNGLDSHLGSKTKAVQAKTASCWLSHVLLWERLQSELEPQDTALVMEDDVKFPENWTRALPETMRDAPDGWDALKVCGWGHYRQADVVDDNWAVPRWPFYEDGRMLYAGSCGYIVSGSGLPRLLKRVLGQEIKDIDVAMMLPEEGTVATTGLAIYEQRPGRRLLSTGGFGSTIREWGEQYSDYNSIDMGTTASGSVTVTKVVGIFFYVSGKLHSVDRDGRR